MTLDEKIQRYAQRLPSSYQEEILDYIQFLLMKADEQEKQDWVTLSLTSAMHGIEDEPEIYCLSDIKEKFA